MSFGALNLKEKIDKTLVSNYVRKESSTFRENSANKLKFTSVYKNTSDYKTSKLRLPSKASVGALATWFLMR